MLTATPEGPFTRIGRACAPTFHYWMETEVHVFAFSIAANVLLSFYPFLIVMIAITRYILHWQAAENAIIFALNDLFPGVVGEFVARNLLVTVERNGPLQFTSIFLLFFTANGIFEPLEVALNRAWAVEKNRSFLMNQIVSLGLIFLVGALFLISAILTGANRDLSMYIAGGEPGLAEIVRTSLFRVLALSVSILILFLIYRLLPNRKISAKQILPVSFAVGCTLELLKYFNMLTLPWLMTKFEHEYGPFRNSVAIIIWSFMASMIVLAGAEWSARRGLGPKPEPARD